MALFKKKDTPLDIFFFNTLGKKKEKFTPLRGRVVKMYTCGPTVYDYAHIGNFRVYVFSDTLRRTLEYAGYEVKQVVNITDVGHLVGDGDSGEDKMTAGLLREGMELTLENMKILAERYSEAFIEDVKRLNIELPFTFPRASEHIPEQVAYIQTLIKKNFAYVTSDGVYFDVQKFPSYGILGGVSHQDASEAHSRILENIEKHDVRDFALWKFNPTLGWDAPFGQGFPGWHIECTAMATKYLGKTFDVHTGGIDHIAVHHNNEIAQAEAANELPLAKYWMHGAFITIEGRRIGKSEGNAIRIHELGERGISPLAYRYLLLTAHYRQNMNFTWESAEAAEKAHQRARKAFADLKGSGKIHLEYRQKFMKALYDDLNTPQAIAIMWELLKDGAISEGDKRATILDYDRVLGIGFIPFRDEEEHHQAVSASLGIPSVIQAKVGDREEARRAGDFIKADKIREELLQAGYQIDDTAEGPVVRQG